MVSVAYMDFIQHPKPGFLKPPFFIDQGEPAAPAGGIFTGAEGCEKSRKLMQSLVDIEPSCLVRLSDFKGRLPIMADKR